MSAPTDDWIVATVPCPAPPTWAILERTLFDHLDDALRLFVERAMRDDGSLRWDDAQPHTTRVDALYEAGQNWPIAYLLGGSDAILDEAIRLWSGVTAQLTRYGLVEDEFAKGEDWFHLGEGSLLFYGLTMATAASDDRWTVRAERFASLYAGGHNWDAERRQIRGPITGSAPPGSILPPTADPNYRWLEGMSRYGLPLDGVEGLTTYEQLADDEGRQRLLDAVNARSIHGDVVQNLSATTLATVAFLRTGDERFRRWALDYTETWAERALAAGELPDHVGPLGQVGERFDGRSYGGYYGWTWPHGFYNVAMAALCASSNALLLSGDTGYLELTRSVLEAGYARGEQRSLIGIDGSLWERFEQLPLGAGEPTFVMPNRRRISGWIDWAPVALNFPLSLWTLSMEDRDRDMLETLRTATGYDWNVVMPFRNKEENGHEAPWFTFLSGSNPGYPEEALRMAIAQVRQRMDQLRADQGGADRAEGEKHHWTALNPIATEILLQLVTGSPQSLYNAGLPVSRVAYWDLDRGRIGLPEGVAALVTELDADAVTIELVNLHGDRPHDVKVLPGTFGEHRFHSVEFDRVADPVAYPGAPGYNGGPIVTTASSAGTRPADETGVQVHLLPGTRIRLRLGMERFARTPAVGGGV